MSDQMSQNRRKERRPRALKSGKIAFNHRRSVIDCMIRDLSEHGAKLQVAASVGIPDTFDLVLDADNSSRSCRVAWKRPQELGVEFANEPPPFDAA